MTVREAAVAGIGRTAFSKFSGRTPLAMAAEAAERAVTFRRVELPAATR